MKQGGSLFAVPSQNEECSDVRLIESEAEFRDLSAAWDRLAGFQTAPRVRFRFMHALASWETVARPNGYKLAIIVGVYKGEILLILPLVARRIGPVRLARWLGPQFDEFSDFLVSHQTPDRLLTLAWDLARSRYDLLHFPIVARDATLRRFIKDESLVERAAKHPFITCQNWSGWEAYHSALSKSLTREYRRCRRRLDEAGRLDFRAELRSHRCLSTTLEWILDNKVRWLRSSHRSSTLFQSKREYFQRFYTNALDAGQLVIFEMRLDDMLIAAQVGLRFENRLILDLGAWSNRWRKCMPGHLLDFYSIAWAFHHGIETIDLGVGGHDYKYRFTDEDSDVGRQVLVAVSWIGRFLLESMILLGRVRATLSGGAAARSRQVFRRGNAVSSRSD